MIYVRYFLRKLQVIFSQIIYVFIYWKFIGWRKLESSLKVSAVDRLDPSIHTTMVNAAGTNFYRMVNWKMRFLFRANIKVRSLQRKIDFSTLTVAYISHEFGIAERNSSEKYSVAWFNAGIVFLTWSCLVFGSQ
jgi:hypothetical protein